MISIDQARQLITDLVAPRPAARVPLFAANGRALTQPLLADAFYPSADRAMMDGYVVRADATPGDFRIIGEIPAGAVPSAKLEPGEAMRIFTGALLPENGGRVVMQEDTQRDGDQVTIRQFSERLHIRRKGLEASPGDTLLSVGTRLTAAELAMLAQVGAVQPEVIPAPTVLHFATGNELVAPGESPAPGQIRDTNSTLIAAQMAELGVADFHSHRVGDDVESLVALGRQACDLLLISGGASVGDYDFGALALKRLGFTIHFDRVNLRPGKPLTFATRGAQAAFVIPGNPVSHFVCFHIAVRLAVERLAGLTPHWPTAWLPLHGGESLQPEDRETFWPARAAFHENQLVVTPQRWSTSGDTFSLAGTNALARVNASSPREGRVETLLLDTPGC